MHGVMRSMKLCDSPRILVVTLRRLGDALLTTPLIRSLRRAWPGAAVDVLTYEGIGGILDGNPDVDRIITIGARPSVGESLRLMMRLFKRYDLAISTQNGDRPTAFALIAGRRHAGLSAAGTLGEALKRRALHRTAPADSDVHQVEQMLRLADALGIARVSQVVCPQAPLPQLASDGPHAVIHAAPMFRYKRWTLEGWRTVARALAARGLKVVASGGPDPVERQYLDAVWEDAVVQRVDGRLSWGQLAALLTVAKVYVGPDTSLTHLAAASGCPTVALYGPTDPRNWGPWPREGLARPWEAARTMQRRGNVVLVQNPLPCLPCRQEGCNRRLDSESRCLDELTPAQVLTAVEEAMTRNREGRCDGAMSWRTGFT
jgi:heptosyltransferase-3